MSKSVPSEKVVPRVYLADIVVAQFRRTSESLCYKNKFEDSFQELNFVMASYDISQLREKYNKPRGIKTSKINHIIENLWTH